MTARPPRAPTKGDARRARPRGASQSERKARPHSVVPADAFEGIADDDVLDVRGLDGPATEGQRGWSDAADGVALRLLVLEAAPHLASVQGAIAAAGHVVVSGASGGAGVEKLRFALGDVDAVLVGLPGGEPLIEAARAHPRRPVVIAASTAGGVEATRRAVAAGADLATARPHDVERLAPILLAAARLAEQRRRLPSVSEDFSVLAGLDDEGDAGDQRGLVAFDHLHATALRELARAQQFGYPMSLAMFRVEIATAPPAALRGILRARAGNALVHALRDIDLASELDQERFLVVMPHTERTAAAEVARRVISAVGAGATVSAAGRTFAVKLVGAVAARAGESGELSAQLDQLIVDTNQLLEQAQVTGASLAVET